MGDLRPIGVFDSGVGGLTVLLELQRVLDREPTVYLGDLARCPYGPRPQAEVRAFAIQVGDYLASLGIKLLVVACNTATAAAYQVLRDRYPFPCVGVVAPGAAAAARATRNGRIGVVATDGTVASGAYRRAILECRPDAVVVEHAASWLVPLIESGPHHDVAIEDRLTAEMTELRRTGIDTLILGCTHFPLVRAIFQRAVGPDVTLLDSAGTTVMEVARLLREFGLEADGVPGHRVLVTGPAGAFGARAETMFRTSPAIETVNLSGTVWDARENNDLMRSS
ncbi:MAG TPA: glutamate racemase [Chloroflexota bacterium]|nr:glutamate racemase [Chloroflexota bacterium]